MVQQQQKKSISQSSASSGKKKDSHTLLIVVIILLIIVVVILAVFLALMNHGNTPSPTPHTSSPQPEPKPHTPTPTSTPTGLPVYLKELFLKKFEGSVYQVICAFCKQVNASKFAGGKKTDYDLDSITIPQFVKMKKFTNDLFNQYDITQKEIDGFDFPLEYNIYSTILKLSAEYMIYMNCNKEDVVKQAMDLVSQVPSELDCKTRIVEKIDVDSIKNYFKNIATKLIFGGCLYRTAVKNCPSEKKVVGFY
jgi:hypothetical protein